MKIYKILNKQVEVGDLIATGLVDVQISIEKNRYGIEVNVDKSNLRVISSEDITHKNNWADPFITNKIWVIGVVKVINIFTHNDKEYVNIVDSLNRVYSIPKSNVTPIEIDLIADSIFSKKQLILELEDMLLSRYKVTLNTAIMDKEKELENLKNNQKLEIEEIKKAVKKTVKEFNIKSYKN